MEESRDQIYFELEQLIIDYEAGLMTFREYVEIINRILEELYDQ